MIFEDKINKTLDECRPYLQIDGGDCEFVSFDEDSGILNLRLLGSCAECPISIMTLRAGLERLIKTRIPEVKRVEQVK